MKQIGGMATKRGHTRGTGTNGLHAKHLVRNLACPHLARLARQKILDNTQLTELCEAGLNLSDEILTTTANASGRVYTEIATNLSR